MEVSEKKILTVPQYLQLIENYPSFVWIYRGQADILWPLRPKAGRPEYFLEENEERCNKGYPPRDLGRFKDWREQAVAYTKSLPDNDLECLAYAQHYGLATRLLDWTKNPLVALYFAAESESSKDGAVYCYLSWRIIEAHKTQLNSINNIVLYLPRPFDRRILAQGGVFTFHPQPEIPLTPDKPHPDAAQIAPDGVDLVVFRVLADTKKILLRQLSDIGINRKTLFPDLEGLSHMINWETMRMVPED